MLLPIRTCESLRYKGRRELIFIVLNQYPIIRLFDAELQTCKKVVVTEAEMQRLLYYCVQLSFIIYAV